MGLADSYVPGAATRCAPTQPVAYWQRRTLDASEAAERARIEATLAWHRVTKDTAHPQPHQTLRLRIQWNPGKCIITQARHGSRP